MCSSSTADESGSRNPHPASDPPSASPFPSSDPAPEESQSEEAALTVLLAEDNTTDIFVIRELLGTCDVKFQLEVVRNGQEALQYFQRLADDPGTPLPAVVLLDLNLPKVTGIEVLQKIRADERCNRLPVIVVTSSIADSDRAAAQKFGADAYFRKPADLDEYQELAPLVMKMVKPDDSVR